MLEVRDMTVRYATLEAVHGISFDVREGEIVALIGSNGAGKSTTLKALMGQVPPASGSIRLRGTDMHSGSTELRVANGMTMSPEGRRLFSRMTVLENLLVGAHRVRSRSEIRRLLEQVYALFPRVYERRSQISGSLSGGEQQMVAIGRALMCEPRLLLLDEPSLGIAPKVTGEIAAAIERLNSVEKMSVILVEQNARLALQLAHRAYALENGRIVLSGRGVELLSDPFVRKAYLGI